MSDCHLHQWVRIGRISYNHAQYIHPVASTLKSIFVLFALVCNMFSQATAGPQAVPTNNKPSGTYVGSVTITLATSTSFPFTAGSIKYTLNGAEPTPSSATYTGPITLTSSKTLKYRGYHAHVTAFGTTHHWSGGIYGSALTRTYTITPAQVSNPTISPNGGSYVDSVNVSLATSTSGASIRYTTDGSVPTASSTLYTGPFALNQSAIVKAIGIKSGIANSAVATSNPFTISYSQVVQDPVISPGADTFDGFVNVILDTATPGANIYYTTDGSTPSSSSSLYADPFTLNSSAVVKAIAIKPYNADSALVSKVFTINANTYTCTPDNGTQILAANRITVPASNDNTVGMLSGSHGVSSGGDASYSIPINILPSTAGVSPKLSVEYSSGSGNGIVGLGFRLSGLSSIQRCNTTIVQDNAFGGVDLDSNDKYCIDGARLSATSGAYGANLTEYRTEIDSFNKIISYGTQGSGPAYFKVWTKSGEILEYGNTSDSALDATSQRVIYALNKLTDTAGNYFTVEYNKQHQNNPDQHNSTLNITTIIPDAYSLWPKRIEYTGNDSGALPKQYLDFVYQSNIQDGTSRRIGHDFITSNHRLTHIRMGDEAQERKNIQFSYSDRGSKPALLIEIKECYLNANQTEECVPPTTFDWQLTQGSMQLSAPSSIGAKNTDANYFVDFNGDGIDDHIRFQEPLQQAPTARNIYLRISNGTSFGAQSVIGTYLPNCVSHPGGWDCDYGANGFGDFNGDGKADYIYADVAQLKVQLSNGTSIGSPQVWGSPGTIASKIIDQNLIGDINGDGFDDLVYAPYGGNGGGTISALFSTGSSIGGLVTMGTFFQYCPTQTLPGVAGTCQNPQGMLDDLDGDGRADLVTLNEFRDAPELTRIRYSRGNSFQTPIEVTGPATTSSYSNYSAHDINGDGLKDLITFSGITNGSGSLTHKTGEIKVRLSKGLGFEASQTLGSFTVPCVDIPTPGGPNHECEQGTSAIGDINGDGIADIAHFNEYNQNNARKRITSIATPDFLEKVTDGLGAEVEFSYATLSDNTVYTPSTGSIYPERDLPSIVDEYLVKQVSVDNGIGGTLSTSYHYEGGRIHHEGHGHLGFAKVTETDDATGIKTITTYRQDYPYIGEPSRIETRKATNELLAETDITYHEFTGNIISQQPLFPRATSKVEKTYDFTNQTHLSTATSSTTYDAYGNALVITVETQDHTASTNNYPDTYKTITTNVYDDSQTNIDKWFLGRLTSTTVQKQTLNGATVVDDITRESSFEYDVTTGFLTKEIIEPNNSAFTLTKTYTHDAFGNQLTVTTTGAGITARSSSTAFDSDGRFRTSSTNAKGHVESYLTNDPWGGVTKLTGPNLLNTLWEYDAQGRKVKETRADGTQTNIYYNWCNSACPTQVDAVYKVTTTSTGSATSVVYFDRLGRKVLTETENFDGSSVYVETEYDARGRTLQVSQPYETSASYWSIYTYDDLDRVTQENSTATGITSSVYDGLLTTITNANTQKTYQHKNVLGWTMWTEDHDLQRVTFEYDARGNLTKVTDPSSNIKENEYNLLDQKIKMIDPDMGTWEYEYNVLGELTKQWDAKTPKATNPTSPTVEMQYDVLGRLVQRIEAEGTSNWTYDDPAISHSLGKLTHENSPGSFIRNFTFDSVGRPSTTEMIIDGIPHTTSLSYDSSGRVDVQTYSTGYQVQNIYNSIGFLERVRDANTPCTVHWEATQADEYGNITMLNMANGNILTARDFEDNSGRLFSINTNVGAVQNLSYVYDSLGNLTERQEVQGVTTLHEKFTYDNLNRLDTVEFVGVGTHTAATYDALGNITSKYNVGTYSYTGAGPHAVSSTSGTLNASFTYDANGNMETGNGRTITWSSFNKPTQITANGNTVSFNYGPDRARFKQQSNSDTTYYIGSSFEKIISGALTENKHFIRAGGQTIAIHTTRSGSQTNSDTRYLHRDHLGSIDVITDELGNVVERHSFDAFGQRRESNWQTAIGSLTSVITTRGYTGHEMLDGVGLIHMNGRVYDPLLGRFLSADPHIQAPLNLQSHNRYSYVLNNPLSYTDPSGFFFKSLFKKISKAIKRLVKSITRAIKNFIKKYGRTIAAIAISYYAPFGNNLFLNGFASGLVASGGDVKAGLVSGLAAGVIQPTAHKIFNPQATGAWEGGKAVFGGGNAANAFASSGAGGLTLPSLGEVVANSVASGVESVLSGNKFFNGAKTGAFNSAAPRVEQVNPLVNNVVLPAEDYTPYEVYPTMAETEFTRYHGNIDTYFVAAALGSRRLGSQRPGPLNNVEARKYYHVQQDAIPSKINTNLPLKFQAIQAYKYRRDALLKTRELMSDRPLASSLPPPKSFPDVVRKYYNEGHRGDDLWKAIIRGSQSSNKDVNSSLGLSR